MKGNKKEKFPPGTERAGIVNKIRKGDTSRSKKECLNGFVVFPRNIAEVKPKGGITCSKIIGSIGMKPNKQCVPLEKQGIYHWT